MFFTQSICRVAAYKLNKSNNKESPNEKLERFDDEVVTFCKKIKARLNRSNICGCFIKIHQMAHEFKKGDHVKWNSEAGHVSGKIIKKHVSDFDYKGYTHHASKDDPQYEIKSDKSDHVAVHKATALSLMK